MTDVADLTDLCRVNNYPFNSNLILSNTNVLAIISRDNNNYLCICYMVVCL